VSAAAPAARTRAGIVAISVVKRVAMFAGTNWPKTAHQSLTGRMRFFGPHATPPMHLRAVRLAAVDRIRQLV